MDYKSEHYTQDKEIAGYVFDTYFRKAFSQLKDDLVQEAIIKLLRFRCDPRKFYTRTGANKVAKEAMIDYLRKENKHLDNLSLFDQIEEDLLLIETVPVDQDTSNIKQARYVKLLGQVKYQMAFLNGKQKTIIKMYLNRRPYHEIAAYVGVSKSYVGECVLAFRDAIERCYEN